MCIESDLCSSSREPHRLGVGYASVSQTEGRTCIVFSLSVSVMYLRVYVLFNRRNVSCVHPRRLRTFCAQLSHDFAINCQALQWVHHHFIVDNA